MDRNVNLDKSTVLLTGRRVLEISGVESVKGFDNDYALLSMGDEDLMIYGEELRIDDLSGNSGKIKISGRIDSLSYEKGKKSKKKSAT